MQTMPMFLRISLAATCVVAALFSVAATSTSSETMVMQKTDVYKVEEFVFTGKVVANDLKEKTITINGHRPLRRETVEKFVSRGTTSKEEKKPSVKDATQVFQVDIFCRVVLTNKPTARLADVQSGDLVDVDFRKKAEGGVGGGTNDVLIASTIQTAKKHLYDPPPAKSTSKK